MAPPLIAVITLCSSHRLGHLREQLRVLDSTPGVLVIVVWIDETPPPELGRARVAHVPPGPHGLRLAAGRNAGAELALSAGATTLVFLDADCVPGPELVARYEDAAARHPRSLLGGPVTYLPEGVTVPADVAALMPSPHAARPAPAAGTTLVAEDHALFWSLSFAVTADTWHELGGFSPAYEGYGGEDTDFAFAARAAGVPLIWVGGADAFHQWHTTSSPPWQHLDDILRNGATFAARWGEWPMGGWLEAFAAAGAIRHVEGGWVRA